MMGLGNGRRGMKAPPLLVAVLLACIFVLTINYWVTSSRCEELQTHVLDLEGRMRRAAVERGAVEQKKNDFEQKLEKQKEQINTIQSLHSSQLQNANVMCQSEKESLKTSISLKEKLLQESKDQLSSLQNNLKKLQFEYEQLQESQTKKLTFELAQCSNKMKELIEQCEEKLRRATGNGGNFIEEQKDGNITDDKVKTEQSKPTIPVEDLKWEDIALKGSPTEKQSINKASPSSQKQALPSPESGDKTKQKVQEKDASLEMPPLKEKEVEKIARNTQEPEEKFDAAGDMAINMDEEESLNAEEKAKQDTEIEEVDRENLLNMDGQEEEDQEEAAQAEQVADPVKQIVEQDLQDNYNGDEGNEAEPEADKQAELADNDQNVNDKNQENPRKDQELSNQEDDSPNDVVFDQGDKNKDHPNLKK
ncbi:hypothetical protein GDO86_001484 [Hymenochirus boettgeri]|nr:hypothetical protein GDO86_001484 [Hymenochirus boettgeri]